MADRVRVVGTNTAAESHCAGVIEHKKTLKTSKLIQQDDPFHSEQSSMCESAADFQCKSSLDFLSKVSERFLGWVKPLSTSLWQK